MEFTGSTSYTNYAHVAVYNRLLQLWKHNSWQIGSSAGTLSNNFSVSNGTLSYSVASTNYKYGYNKNSQSWQSNYNTDLNCKLFVVNPTQNPNRMVYSWCLLYGANSFSYNCGDGHTITNRWAWKQYNANGNFNPVLTIFNLNSNSTCDDNISFMTTGTNDVSALDKIKLYPNPNISLFTIELSTNSTIKITNTLEQIVASESKIDGIHTIDLKDVSNGIYFVTVIQGINQKTYKVVKE